MANAMLRHIFGLAGEQSFDETVEEGLAQATRFDEHQWYVTLVARRPVDLESPTLEQMTAESLERREDELVADADLVFNSIAVSTASRLGREYFRHRQKDVAFLRVEGRDRIIFMPRTTASLDLSVGQTMESFPDQELREELPDAIRRNTSSRGLRRATYWYLAMLDEADDDWKQFYSAFLALEVLTNVLVDRVRASALATLQMSGEGRDQVPSSVLASLVWEKERMPLASRFALVASYLSPGTAETDTVTFRSVLKLRHDLSHGGPVPSRLPTASVEDLLRRYYQTAVDLS